MKTIKLNRLILTNFMGTRSFTFEPNGKNAEVRGDNSTGKSTLASAFSWLLHDEDIYGNAPNTFTIKTLDADKNVIPGIDHTVEAEITIDGTPMVLKKTYKEVWTKKRGSANKLLTGHSTDYFIDGEPLKKKEYDEQIAAIVAKDVFRLCTSLSAFEALHWTKKREILMSLCSGEDTEIELYQTEKQKKILSTKKKTINEAIDDIPPRIDELTKSAEVAFSFNEPEIKKLIAGLDKQICDIKADATLPLLRKEHAEIEEKIAQIQAETGREERAAKDKAWKELQAVKTQKGGLQAEWDAKKRELSNVDGGIEDLKAILLSLKGELSRVHDDNPEIDETCPTCNQSLPPDQIEAAMAEFNKQKSKRLEVINEKGQQRFAELQKAKRKKAELKNELKTMGAAIEELENRIGEKEREVEAIPEPAQGESKEVKKMTLRLEEIETQLKARDVLQNTAGLESDKLDLQAQLAEIEAAKRSKARIEELKKEKRDLDAQYEAIEKEIFGIDEQIIEKVRGLEEAINGKFNLVKFKLFTTQINQAINPICGTLVAGIGVGVGLNTGATINAGIDIVRTLQGHFGVRCPLFVDNAESVTTLLDPETQLIKLIKDEKYSKLYVEIQD